MSDTGNLRAPPGVVIQLERKREHFDDQTLYA